MTRGVGLMYRANAEPAPGNLIPRLLSVMIEYFKKMERLPLVAVINRAEYNAIGSNSPDFPLLIGHTENGSLRSIPVDDTTTGHLLILRPCQAILPNHFWLLDYDPERINITLEEETPFANPPQPTDLDAVRRFVRKPERAQ